MSKITVLASVAVLLGAGPASAAAPTIADLRGECEATVAYAAGGTRTREAEVSGVRCFSYLEGMAHVLSLNCRLARRGEMGGTVPAADAGGAAPAELVRAFLAWAERHPELTDEHESVAGVAIVEGFPCESDRGGT